MLNQTALSTTTKRIIDGFATTACIKNAVAATHEFAEVINKKSDWGNSNNTKDEKRKNIEEVVKEHQFEKELQQTCSSHMYA